MKVSLLSLLAIGAATVAAQAPPMPTQFNFARCGMNTMVAGIAQSGCSVTDSLCLCKAKSFQKAGAEGIPKKCPSATDQASFINFINAVCAGQQGYPLQIKEHSGAAAGRWGVGGGLLGGSSRSSSSSRSTRRRGRGAVVDGVFAVVETGANAGLWPVMGAAVGAVAVAAVAL